MQNYCTLFDSGYLSRGLAMYESLLARSSSFHLFIFAFDNVAAEYLVSRNLPCVTVVGLSDFETAELLSIKPTRTVGEYCWTCTPHILKYAIRSYSLPSCTYLDADLYFFSDPQVLIEEMGECSILLTEHRYTPEYDQQEASGTYCVQFMTFLNNEDGMRALDWWCDACIDWCFARIEKGRFGDQKYLDDWTERFNGVHVLRHLGGGVAPWNVQQYDVVSEEGGAVSAVVTRSSSAFDVVFYHFHNLKLVQDGFVELGHYKLKRNVKSNIYKPYLIHLLKVEAEIESDPYFSSRIKGAVPCNRNWLWSLRLLKRKILGYQNFHRMEAFLRSYG